MKKLKTKNIFQLRKLHRRQTKAVRVAANRVTRFKAKREHEQREGITEGITEETIALLHYIHEENVRALGAISAEAQGRTSKVKRDS